VADRAAGRAEGVGRIVVVSDEPDKYPIGTAWAPGTTFHHRDELDAVQRELREIAGRHRADLRPDLRRREAAPAQARHFPDPRRGASSSTTGLRGLRRLLGGVELRLGRAAGDPVRPQAQINQSSCNKDFSCVNGFCPSFVTVRAASRAKAKRPGESAALDRWRSPRCPGAESCRRSIGPTTS
jgi:indolepyruvate ferredoxin oxidoreductase